MKTSTSNEMLVFKQYLYLHWIERRVHHIYIFLIHPFADQFDGLAKSLKMHDLSLSEEADDIIDIWAVGEPQDIVICSPRLLLWDYSVRTTGVQNIENTRFLFSSFFNATTV